MKHERRLDSQVWRTGAGPRLVLLHGEFGDATTYWRPVAEALAERYEVVLPDLPGFGESAPLPDFRAQSYLIWLKRLIDGLGQDPGVRSQESGEDEARGRSTTELLGGERSSEDGGGMAKRDSRVANGIGQRSTAVPPRSPTYPEPIVLAGAGFGATIARLFAARHPALVRRLILTGGGAIARQSPLRETISRLVGLPRPTTPHGQVRAPEDLFLNPRQFCSASFRQTFDRAAPVASRVLRALDDTPWPPALTPSCTTLLVWGHDDRYCSVTTQAQIAQELKDTRQVEIFEAGHLVMLEQSHRFSAHVLDFLGKVSAADSDGA